MTGMARKIGIVGGVGWRATLDYYAAIHELVEERAAVSGSWGRPPLEVAVESLDLGIALALYADGLDNGRWDGFDEYHRAALNRLERSDVEVAVIASNTPHDRLPQIAGNMRLKVIDLFEAVCVEARRQEARRLLVLGTSTTMGSDRLSGMLASHGIKAVVPTGEVAMQLEQLIADLQRGCMDNARERLLEIVRSCAVPSSDPWLAGLNCTELPLALAGSRRRSIASDDGIGFLNASMVHVEAALRAVGF